MVRAAIFEIKLGLASGLTPPPTRLRCAAAGHLPMNGEDL